VDAHMGHADAAHEWVQNWSTSLSEQAARAQALSSQVAALSVAASSSDGAIEVTVGGSGVVTGLRLGELARKRPADELAAAIMAVMRRAQSQLATAVAEIAAQTVGADSPVTRLVVAGFEHRFPADGDEADSGGSGSDWRRRGR
jgi:DNA-binding protein YbaB